LASCTIIDREWLVQDGATRKGLRQRYAAVSCTEHKWNISFPQGLGHRENHLPGQIDVEQRTIEGLSGRESERFIESRNRARYFAAELFKHVLDEQCNPALIFDNQHS
jgi:hypothetical protein